MAISKRNRSIFEWVTIDFLKNLYAGDKVTFDNFKYEEAVEDMNFWTSSSIDYSAYENRPSIMCHRVMKSKIVKALFKE